MDRFDADPLRFKPGRRAVEAEQINQAADHLFEWLEEQARLRGSQLRDGPIGARTAETGETPASRGKTVTDYLGPVVDAVSGIDSADEAAAEWLKASPNAGLTKVARGATVVGAGVSGLGSAAAEWEESEDRSHNERLARTVIRGVVVGGVSLAAGVGASAVSGPAAPIVAAAAGQVASHVANQEVDRAFDDYDHIRDGFEQGGTRGGAAAVIGTTAGRLVDIAQSGPVFGSTVTGPFPGLGERVRDSVTDWAEDAVDPAEGGASGDGSH
jgi:hypothetical protein